MKTELQRLRQQKAKYEDLILEKNQEIQSLEDQVYDLENPDPEEETQSLDTSTLDKAMMFEKLQNNWHIITQNDIDAICPL